jgi:hypothetical protein
MINHSVMAPLHRLIAPGASRARYRGLPGVSCVYLLLCGDEVCYIGATSHLKARFHGYHHGLGRVRQLPQAKSLGVDIHWLESPDPMSWEKELIGQYRPRCNTQGCDRYQVQPTEFIEWVDREVGHE